LRLHLTMSALFRLYPIPATTLGAGWAGIHAHSESGFTPKGSALSGTRIRRGCRI